MLATKPRVRMPSVASVVARSYPDRIIGVDNELPWRLRTDLQHFKDRTVGHVILMGRKTFESLGRPLPNRINIVLSRTRLEDTENVKWADSPETALLLADSHTICSGLDKFFVIGGDNIYSLFLGYVNEIWLTDVFCGPINGDAKFDVDFTPSEWRTRSEVEYPATAQDQWPFRISHFSRRVQQHRERVRDEFLKVDVDVLAKLDGWLERQGSSVAEINPVDEESAQSNLLD